ncbi:hypothetical protein [Cellulosimicrobium marinum]|uniref:hypothetical protein n=1 Tax=Cellulosimicrobium marinum TaxID=1638992 RepID=UPI001E46C683|nr:hypothetical protein [Cellulosimicrobium marinum]MCB7135523.1 hypothetical protein [Cellulosimicrobium marinum]
MSAVTTTPASASAPAPSPAPSPTATPGATALADLVRVRDTARTAGAAEALAALAALLPVAALAGECVLLPETVAPPAGAQRVGAVAGETDDLLAWRVGRGADGTAADGPAADGPAADAAWRVGVAWVRTGLCERFCEQAVDRLRGRTVGGTATVNLAPVRVVVADAALAHLEAQTLLSRPGPVTAARLARVDDVLTRSARTVHNLWGAAGFVDDAPARLARTIDLLGHASGRLPQEVHA